MSLRSTTMFSAGQIYCCFTRTLSVRCSMLKEMPLLRAPENKRTGIEMRPKVKCPDQTEAAMIPLVHETSTLPCHSDQGDGLAIASPSARGGTCCFSPDYVTPNRLTHPELAV